MFHATLYISYPNSPTTQHPAHRLPRQQFLYHLLPPHTYQCPLAWPPHSHTPPSHTNTANPLPQLHIPTPNPHTPALAGHHTGLLSNSSPARSAHTISTIFHTPFIHKPCRHSRHSSQNHSLSYSTFRTNRGPAPNYLHHSPQNTSPRCFNTAHTSRIITRALLGRF